MAISNEQALALLKKNPLVTGMVAVCVVLLAALYFRMDKLPAETTQLEEKTREGRRLAENIKNSAQLPEQLAEVTAANKEIETRLVSSGQIANNSQYFFRLESETGVKLQGLRQVPTPRNAPKTGKLPVGFTFSVQGTYTQVFDFLRRLESGTHYCRILTANLVPLDEGSSGGRSDNVSLNLNLELLGTP